MRRKWGWSISPDFADSEMVKLFRYLFLSLQVAGLFGSDSIVFISIIFFENDTILLKYLYFCI